MHALRMLEEACGRFEKTNLILTLPQETALYIGNNKRIYVTQLEEKYNVRIQIDADDDLIKSGDFKLEYIRSDGVKVGVPAAPGPHYERGPAVEMPAKPEEEPTDKSQEQSEKGRRHHQGRRREKRSGEENFKVVEQSALTEEEKSKEKANQTQQPENITETEAKEPSATPKKGGWWNRLIGE